jgi:hypothetical protein
MKILTDCTKTFLSSQDALEHKGYKKIGILHYLKQFKYKTTDLYKKDNKLYYFKNMNHFNTTVYSVTVGKVSNLKGEYFKELQ